MHHLIIVVVVLVAAASAQLMQWPINEGDPIHVDIPGARIFGRTLRSGDTQRISYCPETDNSAKCNHWSDSKGKVLLNTPKSRVLANGTLTVSKMMKADLGQYYSVDKAMRVVEKTKDHTYAVDELTVNFLLKSELE